MRPSGKGEFADSPFVQFVVRSGFQSLQHFIHSILFDFGDL